MGPVKDYLQLTKKDLDFITWFRKYRDYYKAAERAHIAKNQAKKTYERIEIQEEIERQDGVVERERARVQVESEGITRNFLDAELLQVINLDPKRHGANKLRGIELGYVRAGVLQVGNTKSLDLTPPNPDDEVPQPTVYSAFMSAGVRVDVTPILPSDQPPVPAQPASANVTPKTPTPTAPEPARKAGKLRLG